MHADDIRTITNSTSSLNAQLEAVSSFTSENFLQLNPSKCEIVSFSKQSRISQPQLSLDGAIIPCNDGAKCLGYVWSSTLSSKPMIEHNVTKARKSFFCLRQHWCLPRCYFPIIMSLLSRDMCHANPSLWM